jgi:hypothetical protein
LTLLQLMSSEFSSSNQSCLTSQAVFETFQRSWYAGPVCRILGAKVDGFSRLIDASSQSFQTPAGELFRERKKLENFVG